MKSLSCTKQFGRFGTNVLFSSMKKLMYQSRNGNAVKWRGIVRPNEITFILSFLNYCVVFIFSRK